MSVLVQCGFIFHMNAVSGYLLCLLNSKLGRAEKQSDIPVIITWVPQLGMTVVCQLIC